MAGITTTSTLSGEFRNYFSTELLSYAVQSTILDQFGTATPIPKKKGHKGITLFRYGVPTLSDMQALTEGTTPANSTAASLALTSISKSLTEYGEQVILTNILSSTDLLNAAKEAVVRLGHDFALWNDSISRNVLQGSNTTVSSGNMGTAAEGGGTLDNSDTLVEVYGTPSSTTQTFTGLNSDTTTASTCSSVALLDCMTKLKKNRAMPIKGKYVFVTDPRVSRDLLRDSDWLKASNESGNRGQPFYKGELTEIYGCKIVETTNSFVALGSATNADRYVYAASGGGGTAVSKDIITSFLFGAESYGYPSLSGENPFKPSVEMLDKPDKSDPYNQRIHFAARNYWAALRQNPNYYIVYRSKTANTL